MGHWRGGDLARSPCSLSGPEGLSWHLFLSGHGTEGMTGVGESSLVVQLSIQLLVDMGEGVPLRPQRTAAVRTWRADGLKSHYLLCSLSPRCQLMAPPSAPHPCAMAGWGSWGWDLLPVTNHIARDFQPTLSPASGAITATTTATATEDAARDGVAERSLHLAWGAGLSCL